MTAVPHSHRRRPRRDLWGLKLFLAVSCGLVGALFLTVAAVFGGFR